MVYNIKFLFSNLLPPLGLPSTHHYVGAACQANTFILRVLNPSIDENYQELKVQSINQFNRK